MGDDPLGTLAGVEAKVLSEMVAKQLDGFMVEMRGAVTNILATDRACRREVDTMIVEACTRVTILETKADDLEKAVSKRGDRLFTLLVSCSGWVAAVGLVVGQRIWPV